MLNPFDDVELGDVQVDIGVVVVGSALAGQENDGVDIARAEVDDDGMVDAAVRVTVNVAGRVLLVRVVDGVADNFVDEPSRYNWSC